MQNTTEAFASLLRTPITTVYLFKSPWPLQTDFLMVSEETSLPLPGKRMKLADEHEV